MTAMRTDSPTVATLRQQAVSRHAAELRRIGEDASLSAMARHNAILDSEDQLAADMRRLSNIEARDTIKRPPMLALEPTTDWPASGEGRTLLRHWNP